MTKRYYISTLFFMSCLFLTGQNNTDVSKIKLHTYDTIFVAGTLQNLDFSSSYAFTPLLYVSNSYGTTFIEPNRIQKFLFYKIPNNISNKRGQLNWALVHNKKKLLSGKIEIISDTIVEKVETYVGPPSIEAGGRDFSMSVMIPTDTLDNPVMDNSKVIFKKQFLTREDSIQLKIKNLFCYRKIYSPKKTGRFLISSACYNKQSTEHTLHVWASLPTDFTISAHSNHMYADGNQINTITTSTIKDAYGNIVSDGTAVELVVKDKTGNILSANGNTINGVAIAKLVHPDHAQTWNIKAYVYGMAESKPIIVNFEQAIKDYEIVFSEHNREITIGPLKSFMHQMIPDGLRIELDIKKEDRTHKYMVHTSKDGYATFYLDPENYKNETYDFKIEAAGITKIFKNKRVW